MDKLNRLLAVGAILCSALVVSASSLKGQRSHLMFEYNWPEPDPNIIRFPHESSCHHYYLVLSEEDISIEKCPEGQLFDYKIHSCSEKGHVHCWSRHFGKIKHVPQKLKKPFKCPYAWGKYPNIHNCSTYHLCLSGKSKLRKCAPFELFDKIERKCIAEINAVCADKTDVVEHGYKCPKIWGSFTFSKDCSKYYECLQKKPSLRTCQHDKLFDHKTKKCAPKEIVNCGTRHNPYEKITSVAPKISSVAVTIPDDELNKIASAEHSSEHTTEKEIKTERITSSVKENLTVSETTEISPIAVSSISAAPENQSVKPSVTGEIDSNSIVLNRKLEYIETSTQQQKIPDKPTIKDNSIITTVGKSHMDTDDELNKVSASDEFIEVSTTEGKITEVTTSVEKVTPHQDIKVDLKDPVTTKVNKIHDETELLQEKLGLTTADPTSECPSDDPKCAIDTDGQVIRCLISDGLQPHPRDERRFLSCSDFEIHINSCPGNTIYSSSEKKCKWEFVMG